MSTASLSRRSVIAALPLVAVATGSAASTLPDPIINLCAEALRLCAVTDAALSAYTKAAGAAQIAGYPTQTPTRGDYDFRGQLSDADDEAEYFAQNLRKFDAKAQNDATCKAIAERGRGVMAARKAREDAAYAENLVKWQEADARFGITAATAEVDRATVAQIAAVDAVGAMPITSAAGALAVFALAHQHVTDKDEESAAPLLDKARRWVDAAGILPPPYAEEGGAA